MKIKNSYSGYSETHTVSIIALVAFLFVVWNNSSPTNSLKPQKHKEQLTKAEAYKGGYGSYIPRSKHVTPEFIKEVKAVAGRLKTKPTYLMAVMAFETGGTYSPSIQNPLSKATGLIQFIPSTAKGLGTSTYSLALMGATQQLKYVESHFRPFKGRILTLEDTYAAVLYPVAVGKGSSYVLFTVGTIQYTQNQGFDLNKDGRITLAETTAKVKAFLPHRSVLD